MASFRAIRVLVYRLFLPQLIIVVLLTPAFAQLTTTITPDGSLGTRVSPNGPIHTIDGGTIRGPNQFHSFDRFDVGTRDTAHFTGPSTLENILSRVTGGAPSMIDGTLRSDIPGADLYLLNSARVMFGSSASLNVNGSFHVSTADMLRLGEDGTFHVSLAEQSALSVSAPSAFGFLHGDPSGIRIEGSQLAVPTGQTMSVIGGDIIVGDRGDDDRATLAAPSGQLHLVGVASPGEVVFLPSAAEPGVTVERFARLGSIAITDHALVDVSGDGGGTVRIRAERIIVTDRGEINADTHTGGDAGQITLQADQVRVADGGKIRSRSRDGTSGNAGRIVLTAEQLTLFGNGKLTIITAETGKNSSGHAGQITIRADRIEISGSDTRIRIATRSSGNAGTVDIEAEYLQITNDSHIQGSAFSGSTGNAGDVVIVADTLIVEDGGRIISGLAGPGEGGSIDLTVHDLTVRKGGVSHRAWVPANSNLALKVEMRAES